MELRRGRGVAGLGIPMLVGSGSIHSQCRGVILYDSRGQTKDLILYLKILRTDQSILRNRKKKKKLEVHELYR